MLRENAGFSLVEWVIGVSIIVAVVGVVVFLIAQNTASQGNNLSSFINNIHMPTTP